MSRLPPPALVEDTLQPLDADGVLALGNDVEVAFGSEAPFDPFDALESEPPSGVVSPSSPAGGTAPEAGGVSGIAGAAVAPVLPAFSQRWVAPHF